MNCSRPYSRCTCFNSPGHLHTTGRPAHHEANGLSCYDATLCCLEVWFCLLASFPKLKKPSVFKSPERMANAGRYRGSPCKCIRLWRSESKVAHLRSVCGVRRQSLIVITTVERLRSVRDGAGRNLHPVASIRRRSYFLTAVRREHRLRI